MRARRDEVVVALGRLKLVITIVDDIDLEPHLAPRVRYQDRLDVMRMSRRDRFVGATQERFKDVGKKNASPRSDTQLGG